MDAMPIGLAPTTNSTAAAITTMPGWAATPFAGSSPSSRAGTSFDTRAAGRDEQVDRLDAMRTAAMGSIQPLGAASPVADPLAPVHAAVAAGGATGALRGQQEQLLAKLGDYAATLDPAEVAMAVELIEDSSRSGGMSSAQLARTMIRIEGSAANLPDAYLQLADRAQQQAADLERFIQSASDQLLQLMTSTGAGIDQVWPLLEQLLQLTDGLATLQEDLRANFELAKVDPVAARSQLERGLAS